MQHFPVRVLLGRTVFRTSRLSFGLSITPKSDNITHKVRKIASEVRKQPNVYNMCPSYPLEPYGGPMPPRSVREGQKSAFRTFLGYGTTLVRKFRPNISYFQIIFCLRAHHGTDTLCGLRGTS
jgi:hypothetical protein